MLDAASNARAYAPSMHTDHAMPNATVRTVRNGTYGTARLQDQGTQSQVPNTPTPVDNRFAELHAEIERLHRDNKSASEIAAILGCSSRTVERWRQRNGLTTPRQPKQSQRERAGELIADGCTITEAARTVGVHPWTVGKWFPDAPRLTKEEVGSWSALMRRNGHLLAHECRT